MRKNKLLISGIIGGAGAAFLGIFKVSVSLNAVELAGLLDIITQYFLVIAYMVLLYLYFVLQKEHTECQRNYMEVSRELGSLKNRLLRLENTDAS